MKPGYRATAANATLRLSTEATGEQELSLGYLGTRRSNARVRLRCVDGCKCDELLLTPAAKKAAGDTTSTTEFSPRHSASAPVGGRPCVLELVMMTSGERDPFKVVALHVRSK